MVVNFKACGINRGTHKLTRTPILIIIIKSLQCPLLSCKLTPRDPCQEAKMLKKFFFWFFIKFLCFNILIL